MSIGFGGKSAIRERGRGGDSDGTTADGDISHLPPLRGLHNNNDCRLLESLPLLPNGYYSLQMFLLWLESLSAVIPLLLSMFLIVLVFDRPNIVACLGQKSLSVRRKAMTGN